MLVDSLQHITRFYVWVAVKINMCTQANWKVAFGIIENW